MPVVPNFFERIFLLNLNRAPGVVLDYIGALAFRTAYVGFKLGVFETLSGGPLTAADVAREIETDERGTALLLEALDALSYVKRKGGRYANTRLTAKWLVRSSPKSIAERMDFYSELAFGVWGNLEDSVRQGRPPMTIYEWLDGKEDGWRGFEAAMAASARTNVEEIVTKVQLPPTARRLLDLGGSHALHSIGFCRRYPKLAATVFDLPQALDVAWETIAVENMTGRVSVEEGDFRVDPWVQAMTWHWYSTPSTHTHRNRTLSCWARSRLLSTRVA